MLSGQRRRPVAAVHSATDLGWEPDVLETLERSGIRHGSDLPGIARPRYLRRGYGCPATSRNRGTVRPSSSLTRSTNIEAGRTHAPPSP